MTQKDIKLLLKELCIRLPYGVKVSILGGGANELQACINSSIGWYFDIKDAPTDFALDEIKPYLRLMSSMTEKERKELNDVTVINYNEFEGCSTLFDEEGFDWLNAHHFDYSGLIKKGLALEAPEGMYKIN